MWVPAFSHHFLRGHILTCVIIRGEALINPTFHFVEQEAQWTQPSPPPRTCPPVVGATSIWMFLSASYPYDVWGLKWQLWVYLVTYKLKEPIYCYALAARMMENWAKPVWCIELALTYLAWTEHIQQRGQSQTVEMMYRCSCSCGTKNSARQARRSDSGCSRALEENSEVKTQCGQDTGYF